MSENSEEKDRILVNRLNIVLGMVRRGKISVAGGAELADMNVESFADYVKRKT